MAGLYNLFAREHRTSSTNSIHIGVFRLMLGTYARGKVTKADILTRVQNWLTLKGKDPLTQEEIDDLNAIADEIDAQPTTLATLSYLDEVYDTSAGAAFGIINETEWRTMLNIPTPP